MVEGAPILEFKHVSKVYATNGEPAVTAIQDMNFSVPADEDGEFLAILGPSGSGKSTMLNMISGLLQPSTGEVCIMGKPVLGPSDECVTVQQAYTCFPWRTVRGNVEFGLEIMGKRPDEARKIAQSYLEKVHLGDRGDAYPRELSGGMQQRVALARALALQRPILLMDEPFGALDAQTRAEMQTLIVDIWRQERSLIVFVTHDITEALLLADRMIVFSARPAQIVLDTKISFPRPRSLALMAEPNFQRLEQAVMNLLRSPGDAIISKNAGGQ